MIILKRILLSSGTIIVLLGFAVWLFWEQLPIRLILPYLQQAPVAMEGDVEKITFTGETAGEQTYFVYLPEGYNDTDESYRVLYHLHGAYVQESWAGYDCQKIGEALETAVVDGVTEPMIVVCLVDPEGDSMWSDSYDGRYLASSKLIDDLIPHIDENYRTIAARHGRALQGFSMGGFGAAMNGFQFKELFSAVIIWDGAMHNWQTLSTNRSSIATKMFASESYFENWSPWVWTAEVEADDPDLFMIVGSMGATREFASRFKPHLDDSGRDFVFFDSECPHDMFCFLEERGNDAFAFLADSFARWEARTAVQQIS